MNFKCDKCGTENQPDSLFCIKCGEELNLKQPKTKVDKKKKKVQNTLSQYFFCFLFLLFPI